MRFVLQFGVMLICIILLTQKQFPKFIIYLWTVIELRFANVSISQGQPIAKKGWASGRGQSRSEFTFNQLPVKPVGMTLFRKFHEKIMT